MKDQMWQATNRQEKRTMTGTEQEVLDLDNRIWTNKHAIEQASIKSHASSMNNKPLARVRTYLQYNKDMYCLSGVFTVNINSLHDLTTKRNRW